MRDSSSVVIVGGALITTEELRGAWVTWARAMEDLRAGTAARIAVVAESEQTGRVFEELDGPDTLTIAGGHPAICVRCSDPGNLFERDRFLQNLLAREGVRRVRGTEIWRRDPSGGLTGTLQIAPSHRHPLSLRRQPRCRDA